MASAGFSQSLPGSTSSAASVADLDRKTVQSLFAALRTAIPAHVQQTLLRDSLEELKFLIARQPRLSSFHHRRRESLRHPALAMATKNYYQICRRKRLELAVQYVGAELQGQQYNLHSQRADAQGGQADNTEAMAAQRESELVDLLLAEYAQAGGFREDYGWLNRQGNGANFDEGNPFSSAVSVGSRMIGSTSTQLLTSVSTTDMQSDASFMSEPRANASAFFTEVGNTGSAGASTVWRNGLSMMHSGNTRMSNHSTLVDTMGAISGRLGQCFAGGRTNDNGSSGGRPRSGVSSRGNAGHFFSTRHELAEIGAGTGREGVSRADGGARWGAEMLGMVVRRAELELKAGSGGDPFLMTSSRPIELLLTCYGGVQRDPAVMALGAASLLMGVDNLSTSTSTDVDPLYNAVFEEDVRWDQLAQCYRQLLREANSARQAAVAAVARDPLVNDVIRRFWERLTVSSAAQMAHKAQEAASRKRDAGDAPTALKRTHSRVVAEEADEDDLDEIPKAKQEEARPSSGGGAGRTKSTSRTSSRAPKAGAELASRKRAKGKGKGKKRRSTVAGSSTKVVEPASTVAYYMTPPQYVYLHTRLAHVLLPDSNALDTELLYFIQEDLLVDAAYNESDAEQTLYFGAAPRLVGLNGVVRPRGAERRSGSKVGFAHWQEDDSAMSDDDGHRELALRQRFLRVRRHGYALSEEGGVNSRQNDEVSVLVRHSTVIDLNGAASDENSASYARFNNMHHDTDGAGGVGSSDTSKETATNALLLVNMCLSISELPSLTYQQFWCSMMELADNWTCCAGHPVETAIFLWELYAEVFGHNWGSEDKALVTALEKVAKVSQSERAKIDEDVKYTLRSFSNLVMTLRSRERESPMSSSGLVGGLHDDVPMEVGGSGKHRRRRRGKGRGRRQSFGRQGRTSGRDSLSTLSTLPSSSSSSLSSYDSDLSLTEWNAVADGEHGMPGGWVYFEEVGEDGVKRRYRRRVVRRQLRRPKASDSEQASSCSSSQDDDEEWSFVLEEELNEDGMVVRQRKRRCREILMAAMAQGRRKRRTKPYGRRSHTMTTAFLRGRRRKYEENKAKQLRRLEVWRHVATGSSRSSSLTSWSSIDDGTTEDRRKGRRRRRRVRRTGPRRDRLRDLSEADDDTNVTRSLRKKKGRKKGSRSDGDGEAGHGKSTRKTSLSSEELEELLANRDWLCSVLGEKGINLHPGMFDDPAEQVVLYELLRLARESEARGGDGLVGLPSGEMLFNIGDGEGSGGTDLSRLAALLAQSDSFNLDGLDDSALMRRLLGEGGEESKQGLTPNQLQGVLLALGNGQRPAGSGGGTAATETEGMRRRRLYLLRMLEERQAREQQQHQQRDQSKDDTIEAVQPPDDAAAGAAEKALKGAESSTVASSAPPIRTAFNGSPLLPALHDDGARGSSAGGSFVRALMIPSPPPSAAKRSPSPQKTSEDAEWVLFPTTAAERREQERLFREFELYWTDRISMRGRYRVHITEYTREQLEEFFAHLHLGSRQRALLRGRAPLASATSLVGGTLHQDTLHAGTLETDASRSANADSAAVPAAVSAAPLAAAPVKLFTLTTEASLDGALRESYQSYVSDKAFSKYCKGAVFSVEPPFSPAPRARAAQVPGLQQQQQQSILPHLPRSVCLHRQSSASSGTCQGTARQSAQLSSNLLPTLPRASASRLNKPPSSASSTGSPPKVS